MTTPPASPDYLDLGHRADLGIVTARWTRPTTSPELRAGYEALLRYATALGSACRYWLIDSRRRVQVDARDVQWLTTAFYPRLREHLRGQAFLAFLAAPYQLTQVPLDASLPALPHTHSDYCSLNQFTNEADAVRWLLAQGAQPVPEKKG